jgi:hypothetical protein
VCRPVSSLCEPNKRRLLGWQILSYFVSRSFILEIRELDGERQSLVYNHHHELIAASDTIRAVGPVLTSAEGEGRIFTRTHLFTQMKSRAESLDADLERLKVAFSEISRLASEVAVAEHLAKKDPDEATAAGQDAQ